MTEFHEVTSNHRSVFLYASTIDRCDGPVQMAIQMRSTWCKETVARSGKSRALRNARTPRVQLFAGFA
jgi:hypothetical protein